LGRFVYTNFPIPYLAFLYYFSLNPANFILARGARVYQQFRRQINFAGWINALPKFKKVAKCGCHFAARAEVMPKKRSGTGDAK
jgi:hypothetical protein